MTVLAPEDAEALFPVDRTSATFAERVFSRVDASGDCWEWTGTLDRSGYGVIGRGARGSGNIPAHRAVRELLCGPVPEGLQLDHLCRNPRCVNPGHLEPVTAEENKRRGFSPATLHRLNPNCPEGHPKDGVTCRKGGKPHRYCKKCARDKMAARRDAGRAAT